MIDACNFTDGNFSYSCLPCRSNYSDVLLDIKNCSDPADTTTSRCVTFCDAFPRVLPYVYLILSLVSASCCAVVFLTYFSFPRLKGFSSKIFLYRTLMDLLIAIGHVVSFIFRLPSATSYRIRVGCGILGVFNQFALVASNLWYVLLAVDLIKAIRNPFSSRASHGVSAHIFVWGISVTLAFILAIIAISPNLDGPGTSMFYWCWISADHNQFGPVSLMLYYLWHFFSWVFSGVILVVSCYIFRRHLATSSDTRRSILQQNSVYVCVLAIETVVIIPIWAVQLGLTRHFSTSDGNGQARVFYFLTHADLALAILYAVVHSSRGSVDLFVWWTSFSIGLSDFKNFNKRIKLKFIKKGAYVPESLSKPLISNKDSAVNMALRRNAMYCINVGILDAVKLHVEKENKRGRIGSVRVPFVAEIMMQWDEENQEESTAAKYEDENYREQSVRKIQFPPSATLQSFSFTDCDPAIYGLLRNTYGIAPRVYRESFKIKNAADVESSRMLEKFTEGKSGSFFYFTRDFRYIIKTVTRSEELFLQKIAFQYYKHMRSNPNSVIVRFFGLHKVQLAPEQRYITVVVMENIFNTPPGTPIHERYDLKGSRVGRRVLKSGQNAADYRGTMKDLDLTSRVVVGPDSKTQLMEQLRQDVEFLTSCKIMDYSLLLGIHNHRRAKSSTQPRLRDTSVYVDGGEDFLDVTTDELMTLRKSENGSDESSHKDDPRSRRRSTLSDSDENLVQESMMGDDYEEEEELRVPWFRRDGGGLRSYSPLHPQFQQELQARGRESEIITEYQGLVVTDIPVTTYYFGLVDILQPYNLRKQMEHMWKTQVLRQDQHGLSAVNEKEYGERFLSAMDRIFE